MSMRGVFGPLARNTKQMGRKCRFRPPPRNWRKTTENSKSAAKTLFWSNFSNLQLFSYSRRLFFLFFLFLFFFFFFFFLFVSHLGPEARSEVRKPLSSMRIGSQHTGEHHCGRPMGTLSRGLKGPATNCNRPAKVCSHLRGLPCLLCELKYEFLLPIGPPSGFRVKMAGWNFSGLHYSGLHYQETKHAMSSKEWSEIWSIDHLRFPEEQNIGELSFCAFSLGHGKGGGFNM